MLRSQLAFLIFLDIFLTDIVSQNAVVLPIIGLPTDQYTITVQLSSKLSALGIEQPYRNEIVFSRLEIISQEPGLQLIVKESYNEDLIAPLTQFGDSLVINYLITVSVQKDSINCWVFLNYSQTPLPKISFPGSFENNSDVDFLCECIITLISTGNPCKRSTISNFSCDSLRIWNEKGYKWYQDDDKLIFWWNNCLDDEWRTAITLHQGITDVQLEKYKLRNFFLIGSLTLEENIVISNLEGCRYLPELRTIYIRCFAFQNTNGAEDTPQLVKILYRSIQIDKPNEQPKLNELRMQNGFNPVELIYVRD